MKRSNKKDQELRLTIARAAGFTIEEAQLVYDFVKGDNNALSELKEFREWKAQKKKEDFKASLQ